MTINFVSSKDSDEICTMHTKSKNFFSRTFWVSFAKISRRIRKKMRGTGFVFDSVDLLRYNLHKISLNKGGSYIDSPEWLKIKMQQ